MNFIDAWKQAKEGQYFKRKQWPDGSGLPKNKKCIHKLLKDILPDLSEDLLADDWEIPEYCSDCGQKLEDG